MVASTERQQRQNTQTAQSRRILIADDDAATRSMLVELLQGEGYDTLEAKSGNEVLRIVPVEEPDLLLEAHHALWATLFQGGELAAARPHLEQGMRLYDPQRHRAHAALYSGHDPGVCCRNCTAGKLWPAGWGGACSASRRERGWFILFCEWANCSLAGSACHTAWAARPPASASSRAVPRPYRDHPPVDTSG